jgi:hypothetical protein
VRNYWWPQMSCYIGIYIKTCNPRQNLQSLSKPAIYIKTCNLHQNLQSTSKPAICVTR